MAAFFCPVKDMPLQHAFNTFSGNWRARPLVRETLGCCIVLFYAGLGAMPAASAWERPKRRQSEECSASQRK